MRETWVENDKGAHFHVRTGPQKEDTLGFGGR